jgi:hypothetical protein
LKNSSISKHLGLSPATIATYVQRIRFKLGLSTRNTIVAWATAQGTMDHTDALLSPPPTNLAPGIGVGVTVGRSPSRSWRTRASGTLKASAG